MIMVASRFALVCWSMVYLGTLVTGGANIAAQQPSVSAEIIKQPIGVTRVGRTIEAWITQADLQLNSPQIRLLLVAGLDGSKTTTEAACQIMQRYYSEEEFRQRRQHVALSAIVCGNPDGQAQDLIDDNGLGGNPAVGYPPQGDAYTSPTNPEAQYVWRWIGMHAPDLVIELVPGQTSQYVPASKRPAHSLAAALPKHEVGGIGPIPAETWSVAAGDTRPFAQLGAEAWDALIAHSKKTSDERNSAARRQLQARQARTAVQVAEQLAQVYGHELPTVAYIPAVACIGRLRLAQLTGDMTALPDIKRIAAMYIDGSKPSLTDKSTTSDIAGHILWGELYALQPDPRYVELAKTAADRAFDSQGQPLEAMPGHSEMSDAVFMACPILAQVGHLTGDQKYFDMCVQHMRFMLQLNLRSDRLHRHSPLDESAWGRGNGFPALGLALALDYLPEDYAGRGEVLTAWRAHLRSLLAHQDVTGAWHQVIDHPESYRELTSTCMITFAMAHGIRRGWLDAQEFSAAAQRGWEAVKLRVGSDGALVDVCTGTGKMKSLREYLDRTAILGRDPRGGAMALLVATEMIQWPELSKK